MYVHPKESHPKSWSMSPLEYKALSSWTTFNHNMYSVDRVGVLTSAARTTVQSAITPSVNIITRSGGSTIESSDDSCNENVLNDTCVTRLFLKESQVLLKKGCTQCTQNLFKDKESSLKMHGGLLHLCSVLLHPVHG
jgi:hypothetical protein